MICHIRVDQNTQWRQIGHSRWDLSPSILCLIGGLIPKRRACLLKVQVWFLPNVDAEHQAEARSYSQQAPSPFRSNLTGITTSTKYCFDVQWTMRVGILRSPQKTSPGRTIRKSHPSIKTQSLPSHRYNSCCVKVHLKLDFVTHDIWSVLCYVSSKQALSTILEISSKSGPAALLAKVIST